MYKKWTFYIVLIAILAMVGISVTAASENNHLSIGIVFNQSSLIHDKTVASISKTLKSQYKNRIGLSYFYTSDTQAIKDLNKNSFDYVISVGVNTASVLLATKPDYPVLFTLIPKKSFNSLILQYENSLPEKYSAVFLTQPLKRKINLSKIILGQEIKAGIALSDISEKKYTEINRLANKAGISLNLQKISDYNKPIDALNAALKSSDVYIAIHDKAVLNKHTAKFLIYMAYKKNIPVIGYSAGFTKAGAVASIYSTPEQIGRQTAELLYRITEKNSNIQLQDPEYFTVSVNERIRRIQRLKKLSTDEIQLRLVEMEDGDFNE